MPSITSGRDLLNFNLFDITSGRNSELVTAEVLLNSLSNLNAEFLQEIQMADSSEAVLRILNNKKVKLAQLIFPKPASQEGLVVDSNVENRQLFLDNILVETFEFNKFIKRKSEDFEKKILIEEQGKIEFYNKLSLRVNAIIKNMVHYKNVITDLRNIENLNKDLVSFKNQINSEWSKEDRIKFLEIANRENQILQKFNEPFKDLLKEKISEIRSNIEILEKQKNKSDETKIILYLLESDKKESNDEILKAIFKEGVDPKTFSDVINNTILLKNSAGNLLSSIQREYGGIINKLRDIQKEIAKSENLDLIQKNLKNLKKEGKKNLLIQEKIDFLIEKVSKIKDFSIAKNKLIEGKLIEKLAKKVSEKGEETKKRASKISDLNRAISAINLEIKRLGSRDRIISFEENALEKFIGDNIDKIIKNHVGEDGKKENRIEYLTLLIDSKSVTIDYQLVLIPELSNSLVDSENFEETINDFSLTIEAIQEKLDKFKQEKNAFESFVRKKAKIICDSREKLNEISEKVLELNQKYLEFNKVDISSPFVEVSVESLANFKSCLNSLENSFNYGFYEKHEDKCNDLKNQFESIKKESCNLIDKFEKINSLKKCSSHLEASLSNYKFIKNNLGGQEGLDEKIKNFEYAAIEIHKNIENLIKNEVSSNVDLTPDLFGKINKVLENHQPLIIEKSNLDKLENICKKIQDKSGEILDSSIQDLKVKIEVFSKVIDSFEITSDFENSLSECIKLEVNSLVKIKKDRLSHLKSNINPFSINGEEISNKDSLNFFGEFQKIKTEFNEEIKQKANEYKEKAENSGMGCKILHWFLVKVNKHTGSSFKIDYSIYKETYESLLASSVSTDCLIAIDPKGEKSDVRVSLGSNRNTVFGSCAAEAGSQSPTDALQISCSPVSS